MARKAAQSSAKTKKITNAVSKLKAGIQRIAAQAKQKAKVAVASLSIAAIAVGTPVLAYNEQTKQQEIQPVTATISHGKHNQFVVMLTLEGTDGVGETLETTPEHPFDVRVGQDGDIAWVNAIDLKKGQSLA